MTRAKLGHVNIRTDRLEETLVFFETALGFRRGVAPTNPDPTLNVWLYDEEGCPSVHLNQRLPADPPAAAAPGALDHIAFNCTDMAAMRAHLDAAGIAYRHVPTLVPGLEQLILHDPNGIKVELSFGHEGLPPFAPLDRPAL